MILVRVALAIIGIWLCWTGITVVKVRKLDGIRLLPVWSRTLMVVVGLLCIYSALFEQVRFH